MDRGTACSSDTGGRMRATSMFYRCPHCQAPSTIRHSAQSSAILREMIYQCTDAECGHTFVVHAEAVRTLSPSAKPDPLVYLPISENTRRAVTEQSSIAQPGGAPGVRVAAKIKEARRAAPL